MPQGRVGAGEKGGGMRSRAGGSRAGTGTWSTAEGAQQREHSGGSTAEGAQQREQRGEFSERSAWGQAGADLHCAKDVIVFPLSFT